MTAKGLFLPAPEDILPLNAYFKLNQGIHAYTHDVTRRPHPLEMFLLMEYEDQDYISHAARGSLVAQSSKWNLAAMAFPLRQSNIILRRKL